MSRTKRTRRALASQTANGLHAFTAQMKPFVRSTKAAATRGVRATRTWSAPRVERTGQVLQDDVAPKVASVLSAAAERLDPGKPRHASWRRGTGIATASAAASAVAAIVLRRRKTGAASSPDEQDDGPATAADMGDSRGTTTADVDGQQGAS